MTMTSRQQRSERKRAAADPTIPAPMMTTDARVSMGPPVECVFVVDAPRACSAYLQWCPSDALHVAGGMTRVWVVGLLYRDVVSHESWRGSYVRDECLQSCFFWVGVHGASEIRRIPVSSVPCGAARRAGCR